MVVLVEKVEQIFDNDNNKWQRLIDKLILADDDDLISSIMMMILPS